jgi:hypothetical protein
MNNIYVSCKILHFIHFEDAIFQLNRFNITSDSENRGFLSLSMNISFYSIN